ncbi:MAG: SPOR domain-containing protein [Bacteroidetes bacterium]|nr:SPOR domain-containing protein [Bacteroidota bacterium]
MSLKIPKIGVVEVPAFVRNEFLYLPLTDLFTFVKIQNTPSPGYDSISGFFINQQSDYLIDRSFNRIRYQNRIVELSDGDLIRTENNLYLRSDYFGQVFGLNVLFDFRAMTATLSTNFELPVIREMRMELMRKDLSRLKGEIKADTFIGRKYPLFHFGMADWTVSATQQIAGKNNVWLGLTLGSLIAGGEANVGLTYSNQQAFSEKHQYYLWHYANNDRQALRQVMLGKISAVATSSIYAPMVGLQFTNTPTTFRRSFGSYTLTDYTEPGWVVELYVNNVLVDYLKADASGFFTFEVPLVYGTSAILLRFYGPWGEERSRERSISIPFNFLPPHKLEYTVTAAMVENAQNSLFSRVNVNYGLNQRATIGGGVEYLSSVVPGSVMPFVNLSLRLGSNLLLSGEYSYGVRFKGILSYRLFRNIQLELNYFRYQKDQKAVSTNYIEERKVMISVPVRVKKFVSLVRLTLDQVLLNKTRNLTAELLISGTLYGVSANLTTFGLFFDPLRPYIYSTLSLGFRLPARFILIPQVQYDYSHSRLVSMKAELERKMFRHGVIKLSYEHNFAVNIQNIMIGMRYDFPFAQSGFSAMYGNKNISLVQSFRGSMLFDAKTKWIGLNNMTNVGKGGLVIIPFLDLNANGKRDKDEPKVTGLNLHITGGRIEQNKRDSSIRVLDLEPFTSYFIETDKAGFDNVAWQIKKPVISVAIDPNQLKLIELPIAVFGEGSGMVYVKKEGELIGQGRIIVSFFRDDSTFAGRTLTEGDGYFSYLGLAPGSYYVKVDEGQMRRLNMSVFPESLPFTITKNREGDLAGGLDFVLQPMLSDTTAVIVMNTDGTHQITGDGKGRQPIIEVFEPKPMPSSSLVDSTDIIIQVEAFREQKNAINAKYRLQKIVNKQVTIVFESKVYNVRIQGLNQIDSASQMLIRIKENGFSGAFILKK